MRAALSQKCFLASLNNQKDFFGFARKYLEQCLRFSKGGLLQCSENNYKGFAYHSEHYKECLNLNGLNIHSPLPSSSDDDDHDDSGTQKNPKWNILGLLKRDQNVIKSSNIYHSPAVLVNNIVVKVKNNKKAKKKQPK